MAIFTKKRIQISISSEIERALSLLARRDLVPTATKAAHLLKQALEWEEDVVWDSVARGRMETPRFVSHERAWHIKN
jgi:hypothetical protein